MDTVYNNITKITNDIAGPDLLASPTDSANSVKRVDLAESN
jgi:hypothetical protein